MLVETHVAARVCGTAHPEARHRLDVHAYQIGAIPIRECVAAWRSIEHEPGWTVGRADRAFEEFVESEAVLVRDEDVVTVLPNVPSICSALVAWNP
jgi:hypothetical protein